MPFGLYIHIPYCRSRCRYCDFYAHGASRAVPDAYIDALLRDFAALAPRENGAPARPATVYFGGGTPGLLSAAQVGRILKAVNPMPGAEITLETNPDLATPGMLAGWRAAGVNRLSLGVQTAREDSLRRLGRLHTAADAARALQNARAAGFANLSGDIMLALPGYTRAEFDETLALLSDNGATHISAYLLKIEPGTAFGKNPPPGLPSADESADFYLYAADALEAAGYARYELSNFARPGFEGRHNLLYWGCEDVLGLGAGAHTLLAGRRFAFAPDANAYMNAPLPPQPLGKDDASDYIMLRLRLRDGLQEAALQQRYAAQLTPAQKALLQRLVGEGLAEHTGDTWRLTSRGLMVENAILAALL